MPSRWLFVVLLASFAFPSSWAQTQPDEDLYGEKIREYTTDPRFLNELVDHLPDSETVPSPLDFFGEIIGTPGLLHNTTEIYAYLDRLAESSPRVTIRRIGQSEEGRDMVELAVSSREGIEQLETNRELLNRLADPRSLDPDDARAAIQRARPIYYLTAGLHSPETGSPEMIMELAYRLAVEETEFIRQIRDNTVVMMTIAEPDGRDRIVDVYRYRAENRGQAPGLPYWGRYVAHDNNRDGFGLALNLTRNILAAFLHWKPTVMHDLHESVPYLYVSTGTGPYNETIDPVAIYEWHNLAHEEVTELTRRGMPGVWTHGFYTGWAANYLIWIANNRNALGRFYETFGNSIPDTVERTLTSRSTDRQWYRPSPPLEKVQWSLRNNTNYMQSGVLVALNYVARHPARFLENFYQRSVRAVEQGQSQPPHAFLIPAEQSRRGAAADLVNLLLAQGLEIHRLTEAWPRTVPETEGDKPNGNDEATAESAAAGSFVVRLDQPYGPLAKILLGKQTFPRDQTPPYDDTGWSLPLLRNVEMNTVADASILAAPMDLVGSEVHPPGGVEGDDPVLLLNNTAENQFAMFFFRNAEHPMKATREAFEAGGKSFAAGSLVIEPSNGQARESLIGTARQLGLTLHTSAEAPSVESHELTVPRVALVHTWVSTPQDAGWWTFAFDKLEIPYTYLAEQDLADTDLTRFDVLILPRTGASPQTLVAGRSQVGDPLPWQPSEKYPSLGKIDQTDDVRRGMGYQGLDRLKQFLEAGGVLITEGTTAAFPIDFALTRRVSIRETRNLVARGSVLRATISDAKSPITYGYHDSVPVYFSQRPVFSIDKNLGGYRIPEWLQEETWQREVPRPVIEFAKKDLLLSGMLTGEADLTGTPAVIDVPVGDGHVVLFANRPFWRWQTHGSHALVFNTLLHWNQLRAGWPERPDPEDDESTAAPGH